LKAPVPIITQQDTDYNIRFVEAWRECRNNNDPSVSPVSDMKGM